MSTPDWQTIAGDCKAFLDAYYGPLVDADAMILGSLCGRLRATLDQELMAHPALEVMVGVEILGNGND